jgi:membrane-associated phospholipid phosphatase
MFAIYLQAALKLVYLDWRPVFLSANFNSKYCDADYGKPSGHALTSAFLLPITLNIIYNPTTRFGKWSIYMVSFLVVGCIMFSRLYFAKHSINQLILGFFIGVFCHVLFNLVFDNWLKNNFYIPTVLSNIKNEERPIELDSGSPKDHSPQPMPPQTITLPNNQKNSLLIKENDQNNLDGKIFISVMLVSNILLLSGVFAAKYFVEFPDSYFFKSFKNCFSLKNLYDSSFSSKIIRDGGAFNIFFGIFAAHFSHEKKVKQSSISNPSSAQKPINIFQALIVNFDDHVKYSIIRLLTIILLLSPCLITFVVGPKVNGTLGIVANLLMGLGLPFLCGYFLRFGYLAIMKYCEIPYFQFDDPKGLKEPQQVNNN